MTSGSPAAGLGVVADPPDRFIIPGWAITAKGEFGLKCGRKVELELAHEIEEQRGSETERTDSQYD